MDARWKNAVLAFFSTAGGLLVRALGGMDVALGALLGFMAADYVTGLITAGVFHKSNKTETGKLESRACFKGLVRKCCILLLVFLAVLLDKAAGTGFIRPSVCLFFLSNEGISIVENLGLMGLPCPEFLQTLLTTLREKGGKGKEGS